MRFAARVFSSATVLASSVGLFTPDAVAQSVASLTASVVDPSKAVVPGAEVHLRRISTGEDHEAAANHAGLASFVALAPGAYAITVMEPGFRKYEATVHLATGDARTLDVTLQPGQETSITVHERSADALDTDAAIKTTIDQEEVRNLPLNGRTFQNLIAVTPGVSRSGGPGLFSFNGQRDNTNYFTLDGVAANTGITETQGAGLGQYGAGQTPSLSAAGTTSSLLSLDALEQITIQADNYSAEYGRSAGGQIQLTSRSGTNDLHGSVFDFIRNDALDAWNPYSKFLNQTDNAGIAKPALRLNDFGGTLGGPVRIPHVYNGKDRTFFFASYEGLRVDSPGSAIFETLTAADRTMGNSVVNSYLALAPPQGTSTLGQPLVDQYGVAAYARSYQNRLSTNATSVRFDETLNSRADIFFRVAYAPSYSSARSSTDVGELDTTHEYNYTFTAGSSQAFTPHVVNQFRANYTRSGGHNTSALSSYGGAVAPIAGQYAQMFPSQYGASTTNSMFVFGDYASDAFGFQVGSAAENVLRQVNVIDNMTWLKGRHQIKAGVDWRMLFPTAAPTVYSQTVAYYDPASLASGYADIDVAQSQDTVTVHQQDTALFAEDTWHATQNLTINAGIRWDIDPAPYGVGGHPLYEVSPATASDPSNIILLPKGSPLYATRYNQVQPRISVAYVASHAPGFETLLKAGFGSFYVPASDTGMAATDYWPYNRATLNTGQLWYSDPAPPAAIDSAMPYANQNLLAYSPTFVNPRTYEWNASVQQNLGARRTFTLSYVASHGSKLTREASVEGSQYNYAFGTLTEYFPIDSSDYNSLQASFVQQLSHGLSLIANYTWSHAFDTASSDLIASNVFQTPNVQGERGPSDFDQRNAANIVFDHTAPKLTGALVKRALLSGWGISSIFQVHSGNPLTVTVADYLPSGATVTLRPDITSGAATYVSGPQYFGGRRLNPAAFNVDFLATTARTQGDEPRGYLTDRGFDELDLSVRRDFKLTQQLTLQYRCEAYNLPNQTSYAPPDTQLGNYTAGTGALSVYPYFGGVTNTYNETATAGTNSVVAVGGPRSLEMALHLMF